jgi:hypothetical protein
MSSCCQTQAKEASRITNCPVCQQKGKSVPIITLKSLLKPTALEVIQPESPYAFCSNPLCEVVYYTDSQTFRKNMLKVTVYQKDEGLDTPVCYCFNWTRERLIQAVQVNQHPIYHIRAQIQANCCGCEVNNPQGACCLGNVTVFIRKLNNS